MLHSSQLYVCVFAYMPIWAPCVCIAHRGQKVALGPLELELQVIVNYHMFFQNWTWINLKEQLVLLLPSHLSSQLCSFKLVFNFWSLADIVLLSVPYCLEAHSS